MKKIDKILEEICLLFLDVLFLLGFSATLVVWLYVCNKTVIIFKFASFIPSLFALIAFVFTVRTFLVFKLKEDMQNDKEGQKCFEAMKADGMASSDCDYFDSLKELDKLFNSALVWFSTSILLSIITRIILAFFDKIKIENAIYGALGISCCLCTTSIVIIAGKIVNNIIETTKLENK